NVFSFFSTSFVSASTLTLALLLPLPRSLTFFSADLVSASTFTLFLPPLPKSLSKDVFMPLNGSFLLPLKRSPRPLGIFQFLNGLLSPFGIFQFLNGFDMFLGKLKPLRGFSNPLGSFQSLNGFFILRPLNDLLMSGILIFLKALPRSGILTPLNILEKSGILP